MSKQTVLSIGNFDGVHRGHISLLDTCCQLAGTDYLVEALVFDPHPTQVLRPTQAPAPLSSFTQRKQWLFEAGASNVHQLIPTIELLSTSPEAFIEYICKTYNPIFIVEGSDFRFGKSRGGSIKTLKELGSKYGYEAREIESVDAILTDHAQVRISSTMIRWLVSKGRMRDATILLGRPYELETHIEEGKKRGREIGFPTANLVDSGCLLPADGVYAGTATLPDGSIKTAAISVGTNPTFDGDRKVCEAYLLDYEGPLDDYGWTIRLRIKHWIRDQVKYSSLESLVNQLYRDVERTRAFTDYDCQPV